MKQHQNLTLPELTISQVQANAGCTGGTMDGSLMVTVDNDDGHTYDVQWYLGTV